ncbi:MAG: ArsA family ATPase [Cyanobacteria bacterium P01_D01_bin.128]
MAFLLTFLGKGGVGRSTIAIAAAKRFAQTGKRVLLAVHDPTPAVAYLLGQEIGPQPQPIEPQLSAVQLQSAALLSASWDQVKTLEAQYLRTPFFKAVYSEELGVLPGMDSALALNAIREWDSENAYDVIVYDGPGGLTTLRMWGMPEILSWYTRRFRKVFQDSDLGRALSPFIQPVASTVLSVNWSGDVLNQPADQMNDLLGSGREAVNDPNRVAAFLVTTADPVSVVTAQYLWGSAQQVGLTVGGVLVTPMAGDSIESLAFNPLAVTALPQIAGRNWEPLVAALPDLGQARTAPRSVTIDLASNTVRLFLPGFTKKQVKLTQNGPEVTIEAGDQRRNILVPPRLAGKPVQGAKFQDQYLIISF